MLMHRSLMLIIALPMKTRTIDMVTITAKIKLILVTSDPKSGYLSSPNAAIKVGGKNTMSNMFVPE